MNAPEALSRPHSNQINGNEDRLELRHYGDGNDWEDITVRPIDTDNDIICGVTTSLSPFAIFEPLNAAPEARGDSYSTAEDTTLAVPAPGVLQNDSDADGDVLSASLVDGPKHGTVVLNADGSFEYTPSPNFDSVESFRYRIDDGTETSPPATVTIGVTPVDDPPVARDDFVELDEDRTVAVNVLANDADVDDTSLAVVSAAKPAHGSTSVNPDGTILYVPDPNYHGADSFQYVISSGGKTAAAVVHVTVRSVNDLPVCTAVAPDVPLLWPPDHSLRQVTLSGATDVDGDQVALRIAGVTQDEPVNGLGEGDTGPDALAGGEQDRVSLRAERSGGGDGQMYLIGFVGSDGQGGDCSGQVGVGVPKNQGTGPAVHSGTSFDSFGG